MNRSVMWTSVFQAMVLVTLCEIASHHLSTRVWSSIETHGSMINATDFNTTVAAITDPSDAAAKESFYYNTLPRKVFCNAAITPLLYLWNIWLERTLPARPRGGKVTPEMSKAAASDGNEQIEEEIVKKWIAQGKVQRSSVSWRNTLLKWFLYITFGNLVFEVLWMILDEVARLHSPSKLVSRIGEKFDITSIIIIQIGHLFTPETLASLIGFIIIPAYKRIVFIAAVDLLFVVFIYGLLGAMIPWLMTFEVVREGIKKGAEASRNASMSISNETLQYHEL